MKIVRKVVLLSIIGAIVLAIGMVALGWEVAGHTWPEIKEKAFPAKKVIEKRKDDYWKKAEKEADI